MSQGHRYLRVCRKTVATHSGRRCHKCTDIYVCAGKLLPLGVSWSSTGGAKTNKRYFLLQLETLVYDDFYPNNFGSCRVTVEVSHNVGVPSFSRNSFQTQVFEYEPSGTNIFNVTATDPDNVSFWHDSVSFLRIWIVFWCVYWLCVCVCVWGYFCLCGDLIS